MKKYYFLIIVALIFGLVLTGCTLLSNISQVPTTGQSGIAYLTKAGTEAEPESFPLYAGQDWEVGEVLVWNNEIEVCVKYRLFDGTGEDPENVVGDGWGLTETHLAVVADFADIPTNKSGNPQVGHFPFGNDELTGVAEDGPYCIHFGEEEGELDVGCDDTLVIAAHAKIQKLETVSEECLVSGADSDAVLYLDEDPEKLGYPLGYTVAYQSYTGTPIPSVLAWTHSAWAPYAVAGAEWISSSYYTENTNNNTWRLFTRSFPLPDNAVNISGSLTMNCDNGEEVYLNDQFVGDGSPAIVYGGSLPSGGGRHGYDSVENWDVSSLLMAGSNELWTMTRNYGWSGGPKANPTGLIYKLCYQYDLVTEESAWAANIEKPEGQEGTLQFDGANWATYFEYTTSYWEEELTVLANGNIATSTNSLTAGHTYQFVASGTCNWREEGSPSGYLADASYWLRNDFYIGWRDQYSLAMWNGDFVNIPWVGTYEGPNAHIYEYEYTADVDGPVQFIFTDDGYSDNSGSLTLKIYSCF